MHPTCYQRVWQRSEADVSGQVSPNATEQELKKAYKTGALKYHPGMSRLGHSFAQSLR